MTFWQTVSLGGTCMFPGSDLCFQFGFLECDGDELMSWWETCLRR